MSSWTIKDCRRLYLISPLDKIATVWVVTSNVEFNDQSVDNLIEITFRNWVTRMSTCTRACAKKIHSEASHSRTMSLVELKTRRNIFIIHVPPDNSIFTNFVLCYVFLMWISWLGILKDKPFIKKNSAKPKIPQRKIRANIGNWLRESKFREKYYSLFFHDDPHVVSYKRTKNLGHAS